MVDADWTCALCGMLLSNQFPINYFSVSEVEQWYPDLADLWSKTEHGLPDAGKFWRFNKIHDYGGCPGSCLCFCVPHIVDQNPWRCLVQVIRERIPMPCQPNFS